MNRRKELIALFSADFLAINAAWVIYYWMRVHSGWFYAGSLTEMTVADVATSSIIVYLFWLLCFIFFGLYKSWNVRPPFDEVVTVVKTLCIGTLFLAVFVW